MKYHLTIYEFNDRIGMLEKIETVEFTVQPFQVHSILSENGGGVKRRTKFTPSQQLDVDDALLSTLKKLGTVFADINEKKIDNYRGGARVDAGIKWNISPQKFEDQDYRRLRKMLLIEAL